MLFSIEARRKRLEHERSIGRNTRRSLLECSSALQQNRAQSRLLCLFYNKESVKFPKHYFQFSKQTLFRSEQQLQHRSVDNTTPLIKLPGSVINKLNSRQSEKNVTEKFF